MLFKKDNRTLYKTKPRRKKIKVKVHYTGLRLGLAGLDKAEIKTRVIHEIIN